MAGKVLRYYVDRFTADGPWCVMREEVTVDQVLLSDDESRKKCEAIAVKNNKRLARHRDELEAQK